MSELNKTSLLLVGSVVSQQTISRIISKSKVTPSVAPINFQRNLINGFKNNNEDIDIISLPPVATYPNSAILGWKKICEQIIPGYKATYIPTINIRGLKEPSVAFSTWIMLLKWCQQQRNSKKIVIHYGLEPFTAIPVCLVCKAKKIRNILIMTDPVEYPDSIKKYGKMKRFAIATKWKLMRKLLPKFDSYIFLTEYLRKDVNRSDVEYLIMEGIADTTIFDGLPEKRMPEKKVFMYAGALSRGFGIPNLLEAFHAIEEECELWLFGSGDCESLIEKISQKDKRIKYFGKIEWRDMLVAMRRASCLLSVKPVGTIQAKYQFPSKIMEYMSSGTPVLSTAVEGIPREYFQYMYELKDNSIECIKEGLIAILKKSDCELLDKGQEARHFIKTSKNCEVQVKRLIDFIDSIC